LLAFSVGACSRHAQNSGGKFRNSSVARMVRCCWSLDSTQLVEDYEKVESGLMCGGHLRLSDGRELSLVSCVEVI